MTTLDRLNSARQIIKAALMPVNAKLMELTEQKVAYANQLMVIEQLIAQEKQTMRQEAEAETTKPKRGGGDDE